MCINLVLHFLRIGRQQVLEPLVRDRQTVRVSHMHRALEETTFFRSTVIEENQTILDRHDTVIDTLDKSTLHHEENKKNYKNSRSAAAADNSAGRQRRSQQARTSSVHPAQTPPCWRTHTFQPSYP